MSEYTKGELKLCSDSLVLAQIEGKTIFVVFPSMCNTPEDLVLRIANSKELVRRWNAFEKTEQQRDDLLEASKWINDIISTACDGGDAWCSIRNQPGASEWAENLKAAIAKCDS